MIKKIDLTGLEPLYDKKVQCPYCENAFTTKKVRSRFIKPLKIDSDFGLIFAEEDQNNPLFYYVTVCPECGLAYTEDFSKYIGKIARKKVQSEITAKMDKITNYCGQRSFEKAVKTYKLAIYSGQIVGEKHIVFANLCQRLAWLYRGYSNNEEATRFLQLAASEFEQSYINTDFNSEKMPEISLLFLIGELNRKLGKYNEAVQYFTTVVEHPDKSRYMKYVNLARTQWKLTIEESREKKE
jgi:uncharacterized protein (DUF2225 family)